VGDTRHHHRFLVEVKEGRKEREKKGGEEGRKRGRMKGGREEGGAAEKHEKDGR
jgi:hypothetical protein